MKRTFSALLLGLSVRLFSVLSSLRLAAGLLVWLVAGFIYASLRPGDSSAFFRSIWFLVPASSFFVNLLLCTAKRLRRELKRGSRRHGPDILHLGLLVLFVGAVLSFGWRQESGFFAAAGESYPLFDNASLHIIGTGFLQTSERWAEEWVTVIRITDATTGAEREQVVRANRPAALFGAKLYQASYLEDWLLEVRYDSGQTSATGTPGEGQAGSPGQLLNGEVLQAGLWQLEFVGLDEAAAQGGSKRSILVRSRQLEQAGLPKGSLDTAVVALEPGERVGPWIVAGVSPVRLSGLLVVHDPGYVLVLVGMITLALGSLLSAWQSLRRPGGFLSGQQP